MQQTTNIPVSDRAFLGIALLFQVSILYSVFLLSISMFALGALVLWTYRQKPSSLVEGLQAYWKHPVWWVISLHFIIVLVGGYYSEDTEFWLSRLRLKAPFLLLPMAFFLLPKLSQRSYHLLFYQLLIVMTLSAIPVLAKMLFRPEEIHALILQGQHIPVPGNHIRYSLLVSMAFAAGVHLWQIGFFFKSAWERKAILMLSIFLFVFSHLIAVRSGLVTLYVSMLILMIIHHTKHRKWRHTILALAILILTPFVTYYAIPSVKSKVAYTMEDLSNLQDGKWSAYSDAERVLSIKGGVQLGRENLLFGVGPGDLRMEMRRHFRNEHNAGHFLLPHNQYVSLFAGAGIIGLVLFLIAVVLPFVRCANDSFLMLFNVIVCISMFVENTLESSMGIALYIFYLGVGLNFNNGIQVWWSSKDDQTMRIAEHAIDA